MGQGFCRTLTILLAGFAGVCLPAAAQTRPVAIVTDVQGRAVVQRGGQPVRIALLTELADGEEVEVAQGTRLVAVLYWPGNEYAVSGFSRVRFTVAALEPLAGVAPQRRDMPADMRLNPSGLVQAGVQMRSVARPTIVTVHPVGVRVLDALPEFRWQPVDGVREYEFSLSGESGGTLFAARTTEPRIALPATQPLAPGLRYAWRVRASDANGRESSGIAAFFTASEQLAADVKRLQPPAAAAVERWVTYALWLRQERLHAEADRVWQRVQALRPDDTGVRAMLASGEGGSR
ncbi:MAG: hypothetical protein JNM79_24340 [Burkholderiales bacterium]|nr:hypothetical protein [Burkholderiales bacterium]